MMDYYITGVNMSRQSTDLRRRIVTTIPHSGVIESILDSIGRGVIFVNPDGLITYMNSAAERMLHAERNSAVGKKVYMLPLKTPIYKVLSENCSDVPIDVVVTGRVYAVLASEVKDRQGTVLGEMTEIWDVTEQKKEKRQGEEFVAMITHDLKSPVTVINGYLQMMKMGVYGTLSEKMGDVANQMELSGDRLLSMIEELLEVYQMETGNMQIKRELCDMGEILRGCYRENINHARDKEISMTLSLDEGLMQARLDEKQMTRVFNNIISNAIKFTPAGGEISMKGEITAGNIEVSIEDTGIGIPRKDIARVFNKYFRSSSASGYKGTGLGLAICKAIVEAHGGAIRVESSEGRGSCFTVMISLNEE